MQQRAAGGDPVTDDRLTVAEVQRLLAAAQGSRFEAAFVVAIMTGVPHGELLALRWDDIDLGPEPTIAVRGSLQRVGGKLQILDSKTTPSVRRIAIGRLGAQALRAHRRRQAEERLAIGTSWTDRDMVFPNRRGDYMNRTGSANASSATCSSVPQCVGSAFTTSGAPLATLQIANNQPVKIVSEMLGHNPHGDHARPVHACPVAMQRNTADALDSLLRTRVSEF